MREPLCEHRREPLVVDLPTIGKRKIFFRCEPPLARHLVARQLLAQPRARRVTNNLGRADEINLYDGAGQLVGRLTYDDQTIGGPRTALRRKGPQR